MSDSNKQLVQRWFDEVWNQGNPATIDELFHPDGKAHGFPEPAAILTAPLNSRRRTPSSRKPSPTSTST